jgi:Ca2+:H+ antiporter
LVEIHEQRLDIFETSVSDPRLNTISMGVAAVLIVVYILSLIYQFRDDPGSAAAHSANTPAVGDEPIRPGATHEGVDDIAHHTARWSVGTAIGILAATTVVIVVMSEFLVGVVEPVAKSLGVRELFLGVIVVPIVGNVAEHLVGVQAALKNQMDLSMTISLGSSMQVALFVAPLLVFISLLFGPELTLFFSLFEIMVLGLSVLIAALISVDGESNWLEGVMLLAVYLIAGLGFFYL